MYFVFSYHCYHHLVVISLFLKKLIKIRKHFSQSLFKREKCSFRIWRLKNGLITKLEIWIREILPCDIHLSWCFGKEKGFLNHLHSRKFNNMLYKSTYTKKMGSIRIMKKVCSWCAVAFDVIQYLWRKNCKLYELKQVQK